MRVGPGLLDRQVTKAAHEEQNRSASLSKSAQLPVDIGDRTLSVQWKAYDGCEAAASECFDRVSLRVRRDRQVERRRLAANDRELRVVSVDEVEQLIVGREGEAKAI